MRQDILMDMNKCRSCMISEPLTTAFPLEVSSADVSDEFARAVTLLKEVTTRTLFLWEQFDAPLPISITDFCNCPIRELVKTSDFNECAALSRDEHGNPIRLSSEQLQQIRERGEFTVKSVNFPGESHTWKITRFFLKGSKNIMHSFEKDISRSLAQLVICACDRLTGPKPSVLHSLKMLWNSIYELLDLVFGLPHTNHGDVSRKILEERLRFVTCELSVKSIQRKTVMDFWDASEDLACHRREVPKEPLEVKQPPYRYVTPDKLPIDLRLHHPNILQSCLETLRELKDLSTNNWFSDFKQACCTRLRDEGKTLDEAKELIYQDSIRIHASKVFEIIRSLRSLENIGRGLAETLIQQSSFRLVVSEVKDMFVRTLTNYQKEMDNKLRERHRWLYHIPEWRRRQLERMIRNYLEVHKFDIHENVVSRCSLNGLEQHAFFVRRDLQFLKERERLLRDQLIKSTSFADLQFVFTIPAQLMRHWCVYRKETPGSSTYEPVDRVLIKPPRSKLQKRIHDSEDMLASSLKPTSQKEEHDAFKHRQNPSFKAVAKRVTVEHELDTHVFDPLLSLHQRPQLSRTPKLDDRARDLESGYAPLFSSAPQITQFEDSNKSEYVVQSCLVYKTSTRHFMWRWLTFFVCTYSWLLRLGQLFLIMIPLKTAFSLSVIFKPSPIYLKLQIDQSTGCLYYDEASYQDTLVSWLIRNWQGIRDSRRIFDSAPSRGMLDKSVITRPLHQIWSYLFRGVLTSVLLVIVWPPVCLVVSLLSLGCGLLLPFLLPMISGILHLMSLFVWDFRKPASKFNRCFPLFEVLLRRFLCGFLLQFVIALSTACIIYPLSMLFLLLWSIVRLVCRSFWDTMIFYLIIRPSARIPAGEDSMIKHVGGPGTAEYHFYRARPADVLLVLLGQLELLELSLWRHQMDAMANKPMSAYRRLVGSLSWLSVIPRCEGDIYTKLCTATNNWLATTDSQFASRVKNLQVDTKSNHFHRIKLSDWDLRLTLRAASKLTDIFFHRRILPRILLLNRSPDTWWSGFALSPGDFSGLCTRLLQQAFGENIFTCIVETDTVFSLQDQDNTLLEKLCNFVKSLSSVGTHSPPVPISPTASQTTRPNKPTLSPTPSSSVLPACKETADLGTSSEQASLASDVIVLTEDALSQRGTALSTTASPTLTVPNNDRVTGDEEHTEDGGQSRTREAIVHDLLVLLDTLEATNYCYPTVNRYDLLHVDPPVLPLSSFVPASIHQLPLPLRSFPPLHSLFTSDHPSLESTCNQQRLPSVIASGLNPQFIERSGDYLCHGSHALRFSANDASCYYTQMSFLQLTPYPKPVPESVSRAGRWCSLVFGQLHQCHGKSPLVCSSIHEVVGWMGCVYHPAVIALLIHGRDREHRPLDLSHPALQWMVDSVISYQPKDTRAERYLQYSERQSEGNPQQQKHFATSMATGIADTETSQVRLSRAYSAYVAAAFGRERNSSADLLPSALPSGAMRSLVTMDWRDDNADAEGEMSPRMLFQIASDDGSFDAKQSLFAMSSPLQSAISAVAVKCSESDRKQSPLQSVFQSTAGDCKSSTPVVAYQTGGESVQPDISTATPTISLYGTEDGVSTENVEESDDDALSISSINHHGFFIDSQLVISPCTDVPKPATSKHEPIICLKKSIPPDLVVSTSSAQPQILLPVHAPDPDENEYSVKLVTVDNDTQTYDSQRLSATDVSVPTTIDSNDSIRPSPPRQVGAEIREFDQ